MVAQPFVNTSAPIPINNGLMPNEGPIFIRVNVTFPQSFNWSFSTISINLQSASQSNRFSRCQSVFIDNSTSIYGMLLTALDTGWRQFVPPFTQGMYPVLSTGSPNFTLQALNYSQFGLVSGVNAVWQCSVNLFFLNVPMKSFEYHIYDKGIEGQYQTSFKTQLTSGSNALQILDNAGSPPGGAPFSGQLYLAIRDINVSLSAIATVAPGAITNVVFLVGEGQTGSLNYPWYQCNFSLPAAIGITAFQDKMSYSKPLQMQNNFRGSYAGPGEVIMMQAAGLPASTTLHVSVNMTFESRLIA